MHANSFDRAAPALSPSEQQLAAVMVGYWTDFASRALPDRFGLPVWLPFAGVADDMESLVTPAPRPFFNFVPEHDVQFWSTLAAQAQSANGSLAKNR